MGWVFKSREHKWFYRLIHHFKVILIENNLVVPFTGLPGKSEINHTSDPMKLQSLLEDIPLKTKYKT